MFCVQNVEIHRNIKGENGKKIRENSESQRSEFSENVQKNVLISESFRNVNRENGKKIKENSKSQNSEFREKILGQNIF